MTVDPVRELELHVSCCIHDTSSEVLCLILCLGNGTEGRRMGANVTFKKYTRFESRSFSSMKTEGLLLVCLVKG